MTPRKIGNHPLSREEIVDAAASLFESRGYRATSLDAIAAELEVTKGAVYYHFRSKAELLTKACEDVMKRFLEPAVEIVGLSASPLEEVRLILLNHVEVAASNAPRILLYFRERNELPPEARAAVDREMRSYLDLVRALLQRGINEGAFAPMDPTATAFALLGMASWVMYWYRPSSHLSVEGVAQHMFDLVKGSLASPGVVSGEASRPKRPPE